MRNLIKLILAFLVLFVKTPIALAANPRDFSQAIRKAARRYQFDPLLIMAVIQHESRFNPRARGTHGELGLMQVKPATGRWIARLSGIPWHGRKTLLNPSMNVRIGTAYLAYLRRSVGPDQNLYLTAYNMGLTSLQRNLDSSGSVPFTYARKVRQCYLRFRATGQGALSAGMP